MIFRIVSACSVDSQDMTNDHRSVDFLQHCLNIFISIV